MKDEEKDRLRAENEALAAEIERLREQIEAAHENYERLGGALNDALTEGEQTARDAYAYGIADTEARCAELERGRDGWRRDHGYEKKWHEETREKLTKAESERDAALAKLAAVRGRCGVLKGMYEDKRGEADKLLGELDPAVAQNAAFARGVVAAIEDIRALTGSTGEQGGGDDGL